MFAKFTVKLHVLLGFHGVHESMQVLYDKFYTKILSWHMQMGIKELFTLSETNTVLRSKLLSI